jgi:hypothetical protein
MDATAKFELAFQLWQAGDMEWSAFEAVIAETGLSKDEQLQATRRVIKSLAMPNG